MNDHRAWSVSVWRRVAPAVTLCVLTVITTGTVWWESVGGPEGIGRPWELVLVVAGTWWRCVWPTWTVVLLLEILRWSQTHSALAAWANMAWFGPMLGGIGWACGNIRRRYDEAQQSARRDALTNLPNRLALEEMLTAEVSRAARFHRPLAVGILDCDGLKRLNDEYGHAAGDQALRRLGDLLRRSVRRYDGVFRVGGDEFAFILPETYREGAEHVCERLQAALIHEFERNTPGFTASMGMVIFHAVPTDPWECIRRADEVMYRAKRAGPGGILIEEYPERGGRPSQISGFSDRSG